MLTIGRRRIAPDEPPYVIAEIGVNHDGDRERAIELCEAAARAGADAVKLQLFEAERLLSRAAVLAAYQREGGADDPRAMLRRCELDAGAIVAVARRAHELDLHAIVSVFSVAHAPFAGGMPVDAIKTASPDLVNRPLLDALAATGRPLLISSGAATRAEVAETARWMRGRPHLFLHCVSAYPTPDHDARLAGRIAMLEVTDRALGYSDHTTALDTGALAVASGARVLEKHLTWSRRAAGPDHTSSLDEEGFARYVRLARRAWTMLGSCEKVVAPIEEDVRRVARQSVTARRALPEGHVIARDDLTIKRPGEGIPPAQLDELLGRRVIRAVGADEPLREEDLA